MTEAEESVRNINETWHLVDQLRVYDAAALVAGYDPTPANNLRLDGTSGWRESLPNFVPAIEALRNAIDRQKLQAAVAFISQAESRDIDWENTTVDVDDLKHWLDQVRNFRPAFFFKASTGNEMPFLNPHHGRYAPKLAAAVQAWLSTSDVPDTTSPKMALEKWLRENAHDFGQTDGAGKPFGNFVTEVAKVANWKPTGGAPKTPSRRKLPKP